MPDALENSFPIDDAADRYGPPLPDDAFDTHPKVQEWRDLVTRSEEQVWCTPERHGTMTGIMKAQIDWIPLNAEAVRPTQGKTHCQLFAGSWDLLRTAGANCLRHTP